MNWLYRSRGEGSSTGAAEHALVLEADSCRNAYGARQSVGLYEVTRSLENPMRTITSMLCTGDGAGLMLRTSRRRALLDRSFGIRTSSEDDYFRRLIEGAWPVSGRLLSPAKDSECVRSTVSWIHMGVVSVRGAKPPFILRRAT